MKKLYTTMTSRLHKGRLAPDGKRFLIVTVKRYKQRFLIANLFEIGVLTQDNISILGEELYKVLANKYTL